MLSEQTATIPALNMSAPPTNPSRRNMLAWLFSAGKLWVSLATGRGGMLLNHVRVTFEHLTSQKNTNATPSGKLTSIYLQNPVAVFLCIIPFLRKGVSLHIQQQRGPCISEAVCRIQKISSSHPVALRLCGNQGPFLSLCVQYCTKPLPYSYGLC